MFLPLKQKGYIKIDSYCTSNNQYTFYLKKIELIQFVKKKSMGYLINLRCAKSLGIIKSYKGHWNLNKWDMYSAQKWEDTVSKMLVKAQVKIQIQ